MRRDRRGCACECVVSDMRVARYAGRGAEISPDGAIDLLRATPPAAHASWAALPFAPALEPPSSAFCSDVTRQTLEKRGEMDALVPGLPLI